MEKLDMKNYALPNMTREDSNAIFNCLHILCEKMETFFKVNNDGKDFVYDCVDQETGNTITVRISKEEFFVHKYGVIVICPYCKWELYFQSFEKRIDKTDTCPNCGKKVHVVSEE